MGNSCSQLGRWVLEAAVTQHQQLDGGEVGGALCQFGCYKQQLVLANSGEDWTMRDSWEPPCFPSSPRPDGPVPLICSGTEPFSGLYVVLSLCLHSVGGLILDKTVSDPNFAGMAVFTPVINGEVLASAARGKGQGRRRGFGELCISQSYSRQENPAQLVQD